MWVMFDIAVFSLFALAAWHKFPMPATAGLRHQQIDQRDAMFIQFLQGTHTSPMETLVASVFWCIVYSVFCLKRLKLRVQIVAYTQEYARKGVLF